MPPPVRRHGRCGVRSSSSRSPAPSSGSCPGCSSACSPGSRPGPRTLRPPPGFTYPEPARCRRSGSRSRLWASPARSSSCAGAGAPHRRRAGPADRIVGRELNWTSAGFTKPLRLVLEPLLRPERETAVLIEGGVVQGVSYTGRVPHLIDERVYRPIARISLGGARQARRLQSGSIGMYAAYLIVLVLVLLAAARLGVLG